MNTLGSRNWVSVFLAVPLMLAVQALAWAGPTADHALWTRAIGAQTYLEECYSVQKTTDGGYILAGRRSLDTSGAKSNAFLVKTDANGSVQWSREVDPYPSYSSNSRLLSVVQATDGGYVAAGWVETPVYADEGYLLKTNSTGAVQWQYIYGGDDDDSFASIGRTADGGYILAGVTESFAQDGLNDAWLVKVDAAGQTAWHQVYGGSSLEYAYEVIETSDGGYAFAGSTDSFGNETRVFVQKTSSTGNQQWLNVIDLNGASDSGDQEGRSIKQTSDGGYIVGGWYEAGSDPGVPFLLKLDSSGNEQPPTTYNLGSGSEKFSSVDLADDGGYIAVGRTNSAGSGSYDVLIAKTDSSGTTEWSETYGGSDYDAAYSVQQTGDGGYIIGGKAVGLQWAGGTDMYLIRIGIPSPHSVYLPLLLRSPE